MPFGETEIIQFKFLISKAMVDKSLGLYSVAFPLNFLWRGFWWGWKSISWILDKGTKEVVNSEEVLVSSIWDLSDRQC